MRMRDVVHYLSSHHAFMYLWIAGGILVLVAMASAYLAAPRPTPFDGTEQPVNIAEDGS